MLHEMVDSARTAGGMEQKTRTHHSPTQSWSAAHGRIRIGYIQYALLDAATASGGGTAEMYEMVRSSRFCGDRAQSKENPNPYKREVGRFAEYRRELATRLIVGDTVVVACPLYLAWHHKPVIRESDSCRKSSDIVKTDT
jgi:hypothetical protein